MQQQRDMIQLFEDSNDIMKDGSHNTAIIQKHVYGNRIFYDRLGDSFSSVSKLRHF
jgi:hypothetical protein